MTDPTRRFSTRVENYVKYRPSYPEALVPLLRGAVGLEPADRVADVGSGTGKLSEPFLRNGNTVIGVEPNREMRQAAERLLGSWPGFRSVAGRAEETTLDDGSVDLVVAGQAWHWFDRNEARAEFLRILGPDRRVVLVWNDRRRHGSPLMTAYEALLLRHGIDYVRVDHQRITSDEIGRFFGPQGCRISALPNRQQFDLEGLTGRLLSGSYAPEAGDPRHGPMMEALGRLFAEHQVDGLVTFVYDTRVYSGRLSERAG